MKIETNILGQYLCPVAREVEYAFTSIVCTSPDSQITSITEPDEDLGVWD